MTNVEASEEAKLTVITLCRDNPDELMKTCRSVSRQTVHPDQYLVIDGSSRPLRPQMQEIAVSHGATYVWKEPRGVYPAMASALRLAANDSYVWFINSSDWLAGPASVHIVKQSIKSAVDSATEPVWIVGQLALDRSRPPHHHLLPTDPEEFVSRLASGEIGFPHPSAIIKKNVLQSVGAFEDGLLIAGDYSAALRVAAKYGAPMLIPQTLSVHAPTGLTSQHRVRHAFEKALARTRLQGFATWFVEPFRIARKFLLGRFPSSRQSWNSSRISEEGYPIWGNKPFSG